MVGQCGEPTGSLDCSFRTIALLHVRTVLGVHVLASAANSAPNTQFYRAGLCQAHSWYKKLPFDRGEPFWVFLSPVPRAFGPEYHNEYGLLDWRHPSEGPPRDVETPSGQRLVVPPGVSSGRDARVYLSASCGVRGSLTDLTLSQRLREPQPQSERRHMRILLAQEEQCANEQVAVFEAIVRQCRVIYGQHWQAS